MYFKPTVLRVDRNAGRNPIVGTLSPIFSWGAEHEGKDRVQSACRVSVFSGREMLWDSGWVQTMEQELVYKGVPFDSGIEIIWELQLRDHQGLESSVAQSRFTTALMESWKADWIGSGQDQEGIAPYFRRMFQIKKDVKKAILFVCGIGYQKVTVNGKEVEDAVLQPAHADYSKRCYYTTIQLHEHLSEGRNCIGIVLGEGWRRNNGDYLNHLAGREITFFGRPQLTAQLLLDYEDGHREWIMTDEEWWCGTGPIVENNLFNGETYDQRLEKSRWDLVNYNAKANGFVPAIKVPVPGGKMCPQTLEPIRIKRKYAAVSVSMPKQSVYVFDFGQNIAGVVKITVPSHTPKGTVITIKHAEILDEDGILYTALNRGARSTDTYITGDENELPQTWKPEFTYHGFRYIQIEGWAGIPDLESVEALAFYTDVDNDSYFSCGSSLVNQIQHNILQTERANLHSIATDCPQRDERQGWMNDATVRFEETPYNFNIGMLFPKIIRDLMDAQSDDGAITCTAPFVFGSRPADPVCSSFLVAGMQAFLHTGNVEIIQEAYPSFKAWNKYLGEHSDEYIVNYSYYGDWAGPQDSCLNNSPCSAVTPGILMSTGYYFYNAKLLAEFASILGLGEEAAQHHALAEKIRKAFLDKWWNRETGIIATGSQACQAFALWLEILPQCERQLAALRMHEAVESIGYRITTGNLCTRYLMDMLADYGYIDDAWRLITREDYPSWGYMIQNGATTIWERLELTKDPTMNSYNHPMYGAVGSWLYNRLVGLMPLDGGWKKFSVKPAIPKNLLYAEAMVDTCRGKVVARWMKRYGKVYLYVTVPFGSTAEIDLPGEVVKVGSGQWIYSWEDSFCLV